MAKVVVVKKAPKDVKPGEMILAMPTFIEQVQECQKMLGKGNLTSVNNLRTVVSTIGSKYDQDFSPLASVNLSKFQGREYNSLEQFSEIVAEIFERQYPQMIDKYIEFHLKNRSSTVDTVYFVGPEEKVKVFQNFGFVLSKKQGKDEKENDSTDKDS